MNHRPSVRPASAALLPLAIVALAPPLQAEPMVSAPSLSGAQGSPQGSTSSAYAVNDVPQPGYGAGPGGSSHVGGNASRAWADSSQSDGTVRANAYAEAKLTTGRLHAHAEAGTGSVPGFFSSQAFGQARWTDTVTFNNATGGAVEPDFFWQTDGAITPLLANSWRFVTSSITLGRNNQTFSFIGMKADDGSYANHLGGAQYKYHGVDANGGDGFDFRPAGGNPDGAWRTSLGDGERGLIAATLIIPGGLGAIDIDAFPEVDCRSGAVCDFGHTASFRFGELPAGLSWTSESGVFPTQLPTEPGGALPAPGSLALTGLALLGLLRRLPGR